ncbi:LytR/AlgR family response regulator transcription factor [Flavobacterium sp. '19STA2R22 D10 B1']|uniref:LytR/AlgR family response regulator transcription factor n=1 Tax=Flavobacterium aerium TaxID=3037261 RepID=UPI00278C5BF1|nr:LytTR family DNA-binding domain-containing protein [Flavobacterium sp. '19STA2R22 D10 B1']
MGSTYKCLIVDDEKPAHKVIQSHILNSDGLEFVASAYNGKEAISLLREQNIDILFLDINMPLINGVELMEILPQRPVTIVTTAYSDFALKSYQHDVVDYLMKPVSLPLFLKAVEKAKVFCNIKESKVVKKTTVSLRQNGILQEVLLNDIIYIQSIGNYLKVYLKNTFSPMIIYGTLMSLKESLTMDSFIQIHRSYIINANYANRISKQNLILDNGEEIPIGRKYQILLDENMIKNRRRY